MKEQLVDEIAVLDRTVDPALLMTFDQDELVDYLDRLMETLDDDTASNWLPAAARAFSFIDGDYFSPASAVMVHTATVSGVRVESHARATQIVEGRLVCSVIEEAELEQRSADELGL